VIGKLKHIAIQPRDETIMMLVAEFRFLSREQLQVLLDFPCVTRINIRLKKLFDHGYLSRFSLPTIAGKPKALYFLGPQGINLASAQLSLAPSDLAKERKHLQERKYLFVSHQLFLNEVRIAFILAISNQPIMAIDRWLKEWDCVAQFLSSERKQTTLRPDACLCLTYQGKRYSFFVEVDRSTMTKGRLQAKAKAYLEYARSGRSSQDFGFHYFRVLIITKTEARLDHLKTTIEKTTDHLFYLTSQNNIASDSILDRIWQRAGRQGLFSLLEG